MTAQPLVSVIIAAYNADRYLLRCLDSLRAQTLEDYEVIVVDDGSSDGTAAIADAISEKDKRFKVIRKPNGGVASARQSGLDQAQGEYTIHVDADDWVEPSMLEELTRIAMERNLDMLFCDYWEIFPNGDVKYNSQKPSSEDRNTIFGMTLNSLSGSLCNKLVRRSCYEKYGIGFDPEVRMEEDKLVCLKLMSHPISVGYTEKAYYHYDHSQNAASLCNCGNFSAPRVLVLKKIAEYCDLSSVRRYFDAALFYVAYESIYRANISNRDFCSVYKPYYSNILRAKGFPFRNKVIVALKMCGIAIPIKQIKSLFS